LQQQEKRVLLQRRARQRAKCSGTCFPALRGYFSEGNLETRIAGKSKCLKIGEGVKRISFMKPMFVFDSFYYNKKRRRSR
jgi:hypothetical protein